MIELVLNHNMRVTEVIFDTCEFDHLVGKEAGEACDILERQGFVADEYQNTVYTIHLENPKLLAAGVS